MFIDESFLRSLGIIIVAAAAVALASRRVKMPSIVAYILAGLLVGPVTGLITLSEALSLISEVGIALLLFLVGLELSLDKIRDVGKVAVLAGLGQVVFTAAGGFALCWALGFATIESVFLATALTFSSTVVVVKLLDEKHELHSLYGRIAVGIFLVQDLVVIVILTFLAGLGTEITREAMTPASIARGMSLAFGGMGLLLVMVMLASRWLLPRPFAWAARSSETLLLWSLTWCFLVVLAAEALHLSLEIGAFLAGIALAQLPYSHELRRRVHPLMNFFIAVFFVTLGVQMQLEEAFMHTGAAIALSLFVLIGNPFIFIVIISRMGYGERTSFLTSVTVAQISEFSFIFAAMGVTTGLIDTSILSLIALIGLITIGVSAYMILYNHQLYAQVRRRGILRIFRVPPDESEGLGRAPVPTGHIIVIGMNTLGRALVHHLHEAGERVLAIDTDPAKLRDLPVETLMGTAENYSLLQEAGLARAKLLISALQIEEANDLLAYRCKELGVPCSIHAVDLSVVDNLLEMDTTYLMIPKVDGIKVQNRELRRRGFVRK